MYLPKHFDHRERADLLAVMREHAFATLVTCIDGEPFASHAPVRIVEEEGDALRIEGHLASANPHARAFDGAPRVLVIFHGPHTYISPTLYKSPGRVPTWNYIAVHARGTARAIRERDRKHAILMRLIADHEPAFAQTFDRFEDGHRDALLDAITGFDLVVDRLDGKFKLGQNRLADNVPEMQAVHEGGDADRQEIAAWMKRLGFWS